MAYTAGSATTGSSFGALGSRINSNVAGVQQAMDEENRRKFLAALAAQQQGGGMPQGYDAQGIALGPLQPGGGGGGVALTPPTATQQYVPNAGLNFALNKLIKPATPLPQGYDAEGNPLGGTGGLDQFLGNSLGHGNLKAGLIAKALGAA